MTKEEIKKKYNEKTIFQLIPDKFVNNNNNHYISNALADMYTPLLRRRKREENFYIIHSQFQCAWEIYLTKRNIQIYLVLPTYEKDCLEKELKTCWPMTTVKEVSDYIDFNNPMCQRLTLKHHSCFALNAAKNNDAPLDSIFEVAKYMKNDDKALVQILLEPLTPQYYQEILEAHEQFKQGYMPTKLNGEAIKHSFLNAITGTALELASFISFFITNDEPKYNLKSMMPFQELSEQSKKKARGRYFKTEIRICAEGERKETILKSLYLAFRDMDNDNKLIPVPIEYHYIRDRRFQKGFNKDVFSTAEVEKFIQLPTRKLQLSSPVEHNSIRECPIPKDFFDESGIPFAYYQFRGEKKTVFLPLKSPNEVCRLTANIGATGSGKSEKAANFAIEALLKGHSVFVIDPAQGTLCDSIRDALPKTFPIDHIIDFNLGNYEWPIPIHWQAKKTNNKAIANLMANNLIAYLNKVSSEEMGDRTRELLRSAAKVVFQNGGTLLEIKLMFRSKEFCVKQLENVSDLRIVSAWQDYWELAAGSQRQYSDPVLSRINTLTADDFIGNSLLQQPKETDISRWLNGDLINGKRIPYCVLLRIPKSEVGEDGLNAIATYWIYAIWLSVLNRNPLYTPISWLILDEPHQYLGSAVGGAKSIWGQLASEMRKWGLGVHFYFHSFAQLPKDIKQIILASGVNISLFTSDKETFEEFKELLVPYDLDDYLEMERFYTINRILYNNEWHVFMSKCLEPAIDFKNRKSWRYEYIDRSKLTDKCHRRYGRHINEVEKDIYERESILYKNKKK